MQWATVIYFTKNKLAESVFKFMDYIKENYEFYSLMYNFRPNLYRNDYALSIALQSLIGYSTKNFTSIPGTISAVTGNIYVFPHILATATLAIGYTNSQGNPMMNCIRHTDLHFIDKRTLFEQCIQELETFVYAPSE